MAFFIGLLSITLFVLLVSRWIKKGPFQHFWIAARLATTIMFVQVGIMHLVNSSSFTYMIEGFLPYANELVLISGMTEILLGVSLLNHKTRKWAAWLLILQLIAMFPANVNVAINGLPAPGGLPSDPWYTWSRLLFQPLYIWWIYKSSIYSKKQAYKHNQIASLQISK